MAKSIGTLKAMLVLDSKGFLGGFTKAQQATVSGMRAVEREGRSGRAWLRWTVALRAARMALRAFSNDIMKFRETSPVVNAAVESFFDIGRHLRDSIVHPLYEAVAPAFTFVFESALEAIKEVQKALKEAGVDMEDFGKSALAAGGLIGNTFKLWAAGVKSALGKEDKDDVVAAAKAALELHKILGGDLSGVKTNVRPFVPKAGGATKPDLGMPALEQGTNKAFEMLFKIQRPDAQKDHQKKVEQHLGAIEKNTAPKKGGGDALHLAKLGGR